MTQGTVSNLAQRRRDDQLYDPADDEISLIDLWNVLVKRKWIIAGVALLSLLGGLAYTLLSQDQFAYQATIEIGKDASGNLIETPDNVVGRINESYIPFLQQEYDKINERLPKIDVSIIKGGNLILLKGKGSSVDAARYLEIYRDITKKLADVHEQLIMPVYRGYQKDLAEAKSNLLVLEHRAKLLDSQTKQLQKENDILTQTISEVKEQIANTLSQRRSLAGKPLPELGVATALILDDAIRKNHERLSFLERDLFVELPKKKDILDEEKNNNLAQQELQRQIIEQLYAKINGVQKTHAVLPFFKSPDPVAPNRRMILLLAVILGVGLGIFLAFFMEFLGRARATPPSSGGQGA